MLDVRTVHPAALDSADVETWRALAAAHPAFRSPLLGPDFTRAVGEIRSDARVSIFRRGGRVLGYLPYHRRTFGVAWPIGTPMSDYHALVGVADAGLDGREALAAAGLSAFRFGGLVDPFGVFGPGADHIGYQIAPDDGPEAYMERLLATHPKTTKHHRRLAAKLERDHGAVRLVADDRSPAAFEQLIDWKRQQLSRTGIPDFLGPDWSRALMTRLFERQEEEFGGLMSCLYAGETLVAGHFGVRQGDIFHLWIDSTNQDFRPWAPGHLCLLRAIAAMPTLGLTTYDMGPSHGHHKGPYATQTRTVTSGGATARSVAGGVVRYVASAAQRIGVQGPGPVGRLWRRMDSVARIDLTVAGRLRGLAYAVVSHRRRHARAAKRAPDPGHKVAVPDAGADAT